VSQHESLMVDVERQKAETERLLVRGYEQQQRTDELLADADAARDTARRAVAKAEDTLREANETLRTLRGLRFRGLHGSGDGGNPADSAGNPAEWGQMLR